MLLLGEIASSLPDELRDCYPEVAWRQIRAFRNLAVHKYFGVDWAVVWKIAQEEPPILEKQVLAIISAAYPSLAQSYELGPAPDPGNASLRDRDDAVGPGPGHPRQGSFRLSRNSAEDILFVPRCRAGVTAGSRRCPPLPFTVPEGDAMSSKAHLRPHKGSRNEAGTTGGDGPEPCQEICGGPRYHTIWTPIVWLPRPGSCEPRRHGFGGQLTASACRSIALTQVSSG
jgi:Protein of unknown function DUF86